MAALEPDGSEEPGFAVRVRAHPLARNAVLSALVHALAIGGLLIGSLTAWRVRTPRDLSPFDLQPAGPPGRGGGRGGQAAAAPAAAERPAASRPDDGLEILKKKPAKPRPVKTQFPVVKAPPSRPPGPEPKKLSQGAIRDLLGSAVKGVGPGAPGAGMGGAGAGSGGGGRYDPLGWYYSMVRATLYEAWQQPSALAGNRGLTTRVLIRVGRDGRVLRRSLDRSSGNPQMDASALKAVESVAQLPALPPGFGGDYKDITVDFALTEAPPAD